MNPFEKFGRGLFDTWESLAAGWHELWQRAGDALTRFHPTPRGEDDEHVARARREVAQWGVLAAEVTSNDAAVEVRLEIPGMESDDFDIEIVDDQLVVRGEKQIEREDRRGRYVLLERAYGRFERRIRLPVPVDDAQAAASYRRGVLRITLPRRPGGGGKRGIKVTPG
jgi:HSP20 family protein